MDLREKLEASIARLATWVEEHAYRGYDLGDGLNSILRPLTFGNRLGERVLLQLVCKAPVNVRPLIGIKPSESTKGRGYIASRYWLRHETTGDAPRKAKAIARQEWMIENTPPDQPGYFWGNHFDFVTLAGCKPKNMPIIVWTSLIGRAFLAGYERTQDQRFLDVARGVCLWILRLPPEQTGSGNCLSYVPFAQSLIHNSIMLGAAMLADTWRHTRDPELLEVARSAMLYSCRRQREDGSWWYGETPKYQWIDNFHTGHNLDSVKCCHDSAGEDDFQPHFQRGLRYFEEVFFEENGIPKYYHKKTYLVDIQCMAQSIESFSYCSDEDPTCLELSKKVADWAIDHMQDRDGHFYFRQYPLIKAKMAYILWGQATMFKALALLLSKM